MKNTLCFFLIFTLLLPLAGCAEPEDEIRDPVNFYYRQVDMEYGTAEGVIKKEIRDAQGRPNDYAYLISLYLQGPTGYPLYRPFPKNTALISLTIQDGTAFVELSSSFAALTGLELTLACACITLTVCDLTGAQKVNIFVADTLLDGNPSVTMAPGDLLLDDSNVVIEPD